MNRSIRIAALAVFGAALAVPALAQTVKVTPLGGIDGEFCPQDRALVFEDPNGTRILYDPGRTVAGASDPRLGKIDIILVSHMHGDHAGNAHNKAPNSGTCAEPDMSVSAMPNSNAANIAIAKKSKIVTGSEMPPFFAAKLKANGGNPADSMLARFGGSVTVGGVRIATVTAMHSNGLDPDYIGGDLGKAMKDAGIAGDVGLPTGYVAALQQRPRRLPVRRHRHHRRPGAGGAQPLPGQARRHEHRRRLHDRPGRGRLRDQRAREARVGDRLARQRSRHRRRQGASRAARPRRS